MFTPPGSWKIIFERAWRDMSSLQLATRLAAHAEGTWEVLYAADTAHLALATRLYKGSEATNCKAGRNISAISFSIVFKIEQVMFFRLNREYVREIKGSKAFRKVQQLYRECAADPEFSRGRCCRSCRSCRGETM